MKPLIVYSRSEQRGFHMVFWFFAYSSFLNEATSGIFEHYISIFNSVIRAVNPGGNSTEVKASVIHTPYC